MFKAIIYDADGMVITPPMMFGDYFAKTHNLPTEVLQKFFDSDFKACLRGEADIKQVLEPYLGQWQWTRKVEDLLQLWFNYENIVNTPLLKHIHNLRQQGILCVLATNQEKYRLEYMNNRMHINSHFDHVFASCNLGCLKPELEFFDLIMDYFKVQGINNASKVMFWDDRQAYVDAASNYGFSSHRYISFPLYKQVLTQLAL
jgi:putative hydrolase of the HAD superfamily